MRGSAACAVDRERVVVGKSLSSLWTQDGARLQLQSASPDVHGLNWLFLPGGPGLGSESLSDLTRALKLVLPGNIWHLDLPGDGSNRLHDKPISGSRKALLQAVSAFECVILVAHSSLGMFAQTIPELESVLRGLVLIGSAPDVSWQAQFATYTTTLADSDADLAAAKYAEHPGDETLRSLLIAAAGNSFVTDATLFAGRALMRTLPINSRASQHESDVFDSDHYRASWIPTCINALIINGEFDHITPHSLFKNNPQYQRSNILVREIPGAGHYPWFENPQEVKAAFLAFMESLKKLS